MSETIRSRILDAAAKVVVSGRFATDRLMSAIAREAGLTRQPLYKHFGNIETIRTALVQREVDRYVAALRPLVERLEWKPADLVDVIATAVQYARENVLLQASIREYPDMILPRLTTDAHLSIAYADRLLRPILDERIAAGAIPPIDLDAFIDLVARTVLSLVVTNTNVDVDDPETLRRYLHQGLNLAGFLLTSDRAE